MTPKNNGIKSVLVEKNIVVKSIITEGFLETIKKEYEENIKSGTQFVEQIQSHIDKNGLKDEKLLEEQKKVAAQVAVMKHKLNEIPQLKVGDTYIGRRIKGHIALSIGDNLTEKLNDLEIITKDDIIQDIRIV